MNRTLAFRKNCHSFVSFSFTGVIEIEHAVQGKEYSALLYFRNLIVYLCLQFTAFEGVTEDWKSALSGTL